MLYVTNVTQVFQYSLGAPNIIASKQVVATYDNFLDTVSSGSAYGTYLCQAQFAPDGKIYITTGNSTRYFHTIHYPYFPGVACSLAQHDLYVPSLYFNTLPNHPNYFLGKLPGSPCDTIIVGIDDATSPPQGELKASPNPSNGYFTLTFPVQSLGGVMEIYDVNGKVVFREQVAPWSQIKRVDLTAIPNGVYMCRMRWPSFAKASISNKKSVKIIIKK
jgi:hypothetical protein